MAQFWAWKIFVRNNQINMQGSGKALCSHGRAQGGNELPRKSEEKHRKGQDWNSSELSCEGMDKRRIEQQWKGEEWNGVEW